MPKQLDEEKVDEILETYEKEGSYSATAEKVGVTKSTVRKYVTRHMDEKEDDDGGETGGSVVEMSGTDDNLVDLTNEELMDMSEGEFIRSFFEEFSDMGVKSSFVQMIANQAQIRKQIPDEDQLSQRLQAHNSGVGNANDANGIAELYWALAQRYLRARGLNPGGPQNGGMMGVGSQMGSSGDWVGTMNNQYGGQNQQQNSSPDTDDGDWVSTGPSPSQIQQGGRQPHGQPHPQQQPQNQQNAQMQQMAQMFQQMQEQQQAMMKQMMQSQQQEEKDALEKKIERLESELSGGKDSPADSIQEFVELKETLDKLNDDDGSDERMEQVVGTLQQQLHGIQQQIAEDDSGAEMGQLMAQSDGQFGMLAALAQSGDVDAKEMVQLAQQLGEVETDPGVAEKKYEKEIEEMKVNAQQEKWESIMDGIGQLTETVGETLGGAVAGGSGGGESQSGGEVEPEVQSTNQPEQTAQHPQSDGQSPAQRLVESVDGDPEPEPEPEPEVDEITPDTDAQQVIEVGGDVSDETEPEPEPEPDPEPQPAKADGGEDVICPGCGREDFDTERQLRGHKAHCEEWD